MSELCSISCCWLTLAGFFVFIGTIQWAAGLVLLKSKYVLLLAGPDFWTAVGNMMTGCFLGIAAMVWKKPRKKRFFSRYVARENIVAAILVSSAILNATTATILIMGEGNTMLAIDLETEDDDNTNLQKEILRFAYAASVICPVVCVVVAVMTVTERCCTAMTSSAISYSTSSLRTPVGRKSGKSHLGVTPQRYDWVFDRSNLPSTSSTHNLPSESPSSPSSGCNDDIAAASMEISSPMSKYLAQSTPTVEDLQSSIARMSHRQKSEHPEDSVLNNSNSTPPPLAGEVVAIQIHKESSDSAKRVPVEKPLTRRSTSQQKGESIVDAAPTRIRTTDANTAFKLQRNKMSSFRVDKRENLGTERCSPSKKALQLCKSPVMESIIEVPTSEDVDSFLASPSVTSGYGSSPEETANASKEATSSRDVSTKIAVPEEMTTPRKAPTGAVPKELYGKLRLFR